MKFVVARTFKKNGSAAIAIDAVPSIFGYSEELEQRFGRKIEVLILSGESAEAFGRGMAGIRAHRGNRQQGNIRTHDRRKSQPEKIASDRRGSIGKCCRADLFLLVLR